MKYKHYPERRYQDTILLDRPSRWQQQAAVCDCQILFFVPNILSVSWTKTEAERWQTGWIFPTKLPSIHLNQFSWFWVFLSWIEERNSTGLHYRLLPGQSGRILPSGRNLGTVTTKPIGIAEGGRGERFSQTIISVWIQYPAISSHTQILCSLILRPIHPQLNICCIYLPCWEATLSPLSSPGERGLMDAFNLGDVKIVSHIIRLFTDHLQRVLFRF